MRINSGVILGKGNRAILWNGSALSLWGEDQKPSVIVEGVEDIKFLTACPDGKHFAFWSPSGESFRLMDVAGQKIWRCRVNTDKKTPYGMHFSASGDAVAFIYDYDHSYCIYLYELGEKHATEIMSGIPIGYDADLQCFVVSPISISLGEYDANQEYKVILTSEKLPKSLARAPLIMDRRRYVEPLTNRVHISFHAWRGLAVQEKTGGFIVLNEDGSLQWLSAGSVSPEVTIDGCISQKLDYMIRCAGHFILSVANDIALIQPAMVEHAMLVNRNIGIVWEANNLLSAILRGRRVVAHYADGTVELIQSDGSVGMEYAPMSGRKAIAADIINNVLYIACTAEAEQTIEIKTFALV